jgi:hypothetical protein
MIGASRGLARRAGVVVLAAFALGGFSRAAGPPTPVAQVPPPAAGAADPPAQVLDRFDDVGRWRAAASDDVRASVSPAAGPALRLAFDFRGRSGYAAVRRALPLTLPDDFELRLRVRGAAPANEFQLKLVDESGDNVWWYRAPAFQVDDRFRTLRIRRRQIEFAWGPAADRMLRRVASIELVVAAGPGGAGALEFADLELIPRVARDAPLPAPVAWATSTAPGSRAGAAVDGDPASAWRSRPALGRPVDWTLDLGTVREFGGLTLAWQPGREARDYDLELSADGRAWTTVRRVRDAAEPLQPLALPEAEARFVRLHLLAGAAADYALAECTPEPLAFGATPNAFLANVAPRYPRGRFPRAWAGEQSYWTIVGTNGGADEGLLSEDGQFELARAAPSLEPFLRVDGRDADWAGVTATASLRHRYLPLPSVTWSAPGWRLGVEAFGAGRAGADWAIVRYDYVNDSVRSQEVDLAVAVRPLQVNPPTQFLNGAGGVAPIRTLDWDGRALAIDGRRRLIALIPPDRFVAAGFYAAPTPDALMRRAATSHVEDDAALASGAFVWHRSVPAHGTLSVAFVVPWTAEPDPLPAPEAAGDWLSHAADDTARGWHEALDRVKLTGPPALDPLADTIRSALAHVLINRDGVRLQPGSRSYERSWIRDGAVESNALLRLGQEDIARAYLEWYRGYQFANGKVPCCVDDRGADPVPENDSVGEFVWLADEVYRYTGDRTVLDRTWPAVVAALDYQDRLRAEARVPANLVPGRRALYGLLPASISHEGYSAKPMHSYWDDFWGLLGYESGLRLARARDDRPALRRLTASRDQFRTDLHASLGAAMAEHRIDFLPGSAELGDFDATSTTVALAPLGETARLPRAALLATFERYWENFEARRTSPPAGGLYTPYELRVVGAFVRLGWRERAQALLAYFMHDRRPAAWNQWAEVVGLDPRTPRFVGDMPHGWIESDFIRAALDLFAWERDDDAALVLAAGTDPAWLDGPGVSLRGLRTPWGTLSYRLRRVDERHVRLEVDPGAAPPGGFELSLPGVTRRFPRAPVDALVEVPRGR